MKSNRIGLARQLQGGHVGKRGRAATFFEFSFQLRRAMAWHPKGLRIARAMSDFNPDLERHRPSETARAGLQNSPDIASWPALVPSARHTVRSMSFATEWTDASIISTFTRPG
jgi:hypothetical protein